MKKSWKKRATILFCLLLMTGGIALLQRLVMPKYMGDIREGAMIAEYYREEKNHDVIFIGDCELYENISPVILWEEYGIHSYIRGSAQQLIWQSYYLMEETFRYEKPKVVVFNVLAMKYNTPQKEAYNRMTLDGMPLSLEKIKSVRVSMTKDEHLIEYLFPLLRYHTRITELTKEDFKYLFTKEAVTHNGYAMQTGVKAAVDIPEAKPLGETSFGDTAYAYLDKMVTLCEESGVELVLVKAPTLYPYWYEEWDTQIREYAQEHSLKYYNFLEKKEEIGLDYAVDTYDGGLHLNVSGAEKLASYFGKILAEECGIQSRRGDAHLEEIWAKKIDFYNECKREGERQ